MAIKYIRVLFIIDVTTMYVAFITRHLLYVPFNI